MVDARAGAARRGHDRDRRHHRGLGFQRRRRHPGRPEDLLGARRLWRVGDHRADRAEHQGRHRHPRRAADFISGADRCGVLRSRRRRGEDRHAVAGGEHRGGGDGPRPPPARQHRARSGDGRDLRRPAAGARRGRCLAQAADPARARGHAQSAGSGGAARRADRRATKTEMRDPGRASCSRSAPQRC